MSGKKLWRFASIMAAGSMVLAACGGAAPTAQVVKETVVVNSTTVVEKTVNKDVVVTATTAPTAAPTAVPAAKPADTVVIGQQQEPSTLHPYVSSELAKTIVLAGVFVGCMGQNEKQPPEWIPLGCETVPTLDNGGAKLVGDGADKHLEMTYKIKKGWRWTDGTAVTTKDVIYSWQLQMDPDFEISDRSAIEKIYDVKVVDDSTYVVSLLSEKQAKEAAAGTLKGNVPFEKLKDDYTASEYDKQVGPVVDPLYWTLQPGWLPVAVLAKVAAKDQPASDYAKKPMGDGPYVVTQWKEGQEVDLTASDKPFPLGDPKIKNIVFRFISGGVGPVIAALQKGEVDMVPGNVGGLSMSAAPDLDKITAGGAYKVIWSTGYAWEHIDVNTAHPPLNDPAVRNALFYAIDKKAYIDALYFGKAEAVDLPGPTTAKNSWGYTDNYTKHAFDQAKAKDLLKQAGWDCSAFPCTKKEGDKTLKLKFTLQTTTRSDRMQLAQILQQQWKKIGADANLQFLEARNFFASASAGGPLSGGTFDLGLYTWVGSDDPQFYGLYACANVPTKENNFSGQNNPAWCNKDATAALKQSEQTVDTLSRDKRKPLIEKFFQAFSAEVPVIPLHAATEPLVYRAGLTNFKPGLTQSSVATWNIWEWTLSK